MHRRLKGSLGKFVHFYHKNILAQIVITILAQVLSSKQPSRLAHKFFLIFTTKKSVEKFFPSWLIYTSIEKTMTKLHKNNQQFSNISDRSGGRRQHRLANRMPTVADTRLHKSEGKNEKKLKHKFE